MRTFTLFFCSLSLAILTQGQIIHIPADYPTIQQGIQAAGPGDTVLVSDGLYYENINFLGKKPLLVTSEFIMDGDISHISNTIIDGSQPINPDSASVVYFISGEDATSVLCGFTIQHGQGTFIPDDFGDWDARNGGGIWIAGASARIIHNRITHNTLDDTQDVVVTNVNGAGIGTPYEDANFWLEIADNTIDSNYCISNHYQASGAGIASSYSTWLDNNVISNNICTGQIDAVAVGSGLCLAGDIWENPLMMIVENNTITGNISQAAGMANSGGVCIQVAQVLFSGNEVSGNIVIDGLDIEFSGGGGLFILNPNPGSVVNNNIFSDNTSNRFSGAIHLKRFMPEPVPVRIENNFILNNKANYGGGLSSIDVPVTLHNNVFSGNEAQASGGAIVLGDDESLGSGHFATIINNSFSGNNAVGQGASIFSPYHPKILILNSVFWADSAEMLNEIHSLDTVEIAFSNIDLDRVAGAVIDGGNNIVQDPLFDDPESLTLNQGSPCINNGTEYFTCQCGTLFSCPAFDILGAPRPLNEYVDIGAYETALTAIRDHADKAELAFSAYPNPVSDRLFIAYKLDYESVVNFSIYSEIGALVKSVSGNAHGQGIQHLEINVVDLQPGIYLLNMRAGKEAGSVKVVKL